MFSGFNPRVRAGRDKRHGIMLQFQRVSIHASARDATFVLWQKFQTAIVSIHASARDATIMMLKVYGKLEFQSTRPRGTRHCSLPCWLPFGVSIHASARDATGGRK